MVNTPVMLVYNEVSLGNNEVKQEYILEMMVSMGLLVNILVKLDCNVVKMGCMMGLWGCRMETSDCKMGMSDCKTAKLGHKMGKTVNRKVK